MLIGALCTFLNTCTFMFILNIIPLLLMESTFGIVDVNGGSIGRIKQQHVSSLSTSDLYLHHSNGNDNSYSLYNNQIHTNIQPTMNDPINDNIYSTIHTTSTSTSMENTPHDPFGWCEKVTSGFSNVFSPYSLATWITKLSDYPGWEGVVVNSGVTGTSGVLEVGRRLQDGGEKLPGSEK